MRVKVRCPSSSSTSRGGTSSRNRMLTSACRSSSPVSSAMTASGSDENARPSPFAPSLRVVR